MKKIIVILLILSILFVSAGCSGKTYTYKIFDASTHLPVSGTIFVNGKKTDIKNGVLNYNADKIVIDKSGYQKTGATFDGNTIVNLEPVAFLEISTNNMPDIVYVDGAKCPLFFKENGIVLSPLKVGAHTLEFGGRFIKETKLNVQIAKGENAITINLPFDMENAESFLKEMIFPEELTYADTTINIEGTLDGENIRYTLKAKMRNNKIVDISDKNIHYGFNNNTPFLIGNDGKHMPVGDKEMGVALIYARSVLENMFELRKFIKPLDLTGISTDKASFSGNRTFENRPFTETVVVRFKEGNVYKADIVVNSLIENTNLNVSITIVKAG